MGISNTIKKYKCELINLLMDQSNALKDRPIFASNWKRRLGEKALLKLIL